MAIDSDDPISLPAPPPPRPAARREAIESAMRRFDGVEEARGRQAAEPARRSGWANIHRKPFGALVTAAVVAVVSVPVAMIVLRDQAPTVSQETVPDQAPAGRVAADCAGVECEGRAVPSPSPIAPRPREAVAPDAAVEEQARPSPDQLAKVQEQPKAELEDRAAANAEPVAVAAATPPAPPPPPPPPPPAPQKADQFAEESGQNIVVTGSRISSPGMAKQRSARAPSERVAGLPSPVVSTEAYGQFLFRLQTGLRNNDQTAVVGLIGFPLRVNRDGSKVTYRTSGDVRRDFDEIFTPEVRKAVLNLRPDTLISRDGGRQAGNRRIWFGPSCAGKSCDPGSPIRIREVLP
jgi:hypothetical protein